MLKFIKRKIAERKIERELDLLSNRELSDIGITRSEIRRIARNMEAGIY